jgi:proteasome lid subunit RPN8/RPN11
LEDAITSLLLWKHPEYPYRIAIAAPVLNQTRILAVEAFYSVPRGGVEIGGVFFGVRREELLEVRACRPIKCQYATGPSFTLSVNDQLGLSGLLENTPADPELHGLVPLGWYHSHTRSDIFLSPADLELYNEFFPERWQFALVLRPVNLQPTRGGFFFRDRNGHIKSDAALQEFKLEPPNFGLTELGAAELSDLTAPPQPVEPAVSPVPKPTLVRRPEARELPAPELAKPEQVRPELVKPELPKPELAMPERQPAPVEARLATVVANGTGAAAAVSLEPASVPAAPLHSQLPSEVGLPTFLAAETPRLHRRAPWTWAVLLFVVIAAAGFAYWKWGQFAFGKTVDLGLETYDINGSFLVRWDRDSRVVRGATRAIIEIQDAADKTPIELTRAELSVGGYGYVRRTGNVSVHMKVEGDIPADEYSNFNSAQSLGSQQTPGPESDALQKALTDKEHLKTELINESMQALELRQQIADLKRQLAEERAKNAAQK